MEDCCKGCEHNNYTKRSFDARYKNKDGYNNKSKSKGKNERNLTTKQLIELGHRPQESSRKGLKIGGPNPHKKKSR